MSYAQRVANCCRIRQTTWLSNMGLMNTNTHTVKCMFLYIALSTALLTTHYQTYIAYNNKCTAYKQIHPPTHKHIFNKMSIFRPHHMMSGLDRQIHLSLDRLFQWIYPLQYLSHYIHKLIGR